MAKTLNGFAYTTNPDEIPTAKLWCLRDEVCLYQCPDVCWREHFDTWVKLRRGGDKKAPEPMPEGHLMFEKPLHYAKVPYGCTDPVMIRAAWESDVRAGLDGWDKELKQTAAGRVRLEEIVKGSVDAKMAGRDVGIGPLIACLVESM